MPGLERMTLNLTGRQARARDHLIELGVATTKTDVVTRALLLADLVFTEIENGADLAFIKGEQVERVKLL